MYFLTAVQRKSQRTAEAAEERAEAATCLRGKDHLQIAFACVGSSAARERMAGLWRDNKASWSARGDAEAVLGCAEKAFRRAAGELTGNWALLCCAGELCFYAWRGNVDIRLLNTSFGKSSVRSLTRAVEGTAWEWAELEPQVGILLGEKGFFDAVGARDLTEALAIRSLCSQLQTERHLAEVAQEPAALVVTKTGTFLGSGAFGCVYRTEMQGRNTACKEARTVDGIDLLRREAELLRRLEHPLFPEYYGFTMENGTARLFMEEIAGRNLAGVLEREKQMSEREARRLAAELAEGLLYLHRLSEPVVYRDLKPENIILSRKGLREHARLLDLGCACTVAQSGGSHAGTPGFAAPEQFSPGAQPLTPACDAYALGVVLRCLLGSDAGSPQLRELIAACLREDPSERPSMETMLRTLRS